MILGIQNGSINPKALAYLSIKRGCYVTTSDVNSSFYTLSYLVIDVRSRAEGNIGSGLVLYPYSFEAKRQNAKLWYNRYPKGCYPLREASMSLVDPSGFYPVRVFEDFLSIPVEIETIQSVINKSEKLFSVYLIVSYLESLLKCRGTQKARSVQLSVFPGEKQSTSDGQSVTFLGDQTYTTGSIAIFQDFRLLSVLSLEYKNWEKEIRLITSQWEANNLLK